MRSKLAVLMVFGLGACGPSTLGGPDGGGGTGGAGGTGGNGSCQAVQALDRSCTTSADCVAVLHVVNCCGSEMVFGLRASEQARFQTLEAQCDATYPACGCAAQQPVADDGSRLRFGDVGAAGVACVQGTCTTFVADCGRPCETGTTCFTCPNHTSLFAACTTACMLSTDCHDPTLPLCQTGTSGNTAGMFCTAADVACD